MSDTMTGPRAVLVAALLVGAFAPLGIHVPTAMASDHGCSVGYDKVHEYIHASTPLSEHFTATQLIEMTQEADSRQQHVEEAVNGAESYIYDFGCEASNVPYEIEAGTGNDLTADDEEVVLSIEFYDEDVDRKDVAKTTDKQGHFQGQIPPNTQYMIITVQDGPVVSGINYDEGVGPQPYSVEFDLFISH